MSKKKLCAFALLYKTDTMKPLPLLLRKGLIFLIFVYVGIFIMLAAFQSKLLYYPSKGSLDNLKKIASSQGFLPWENEQKNVIGWFTKPASEKAQYRALVFHGNAGMALHRSYYVEGLQALDHGRWEIYVLEYPGYGARNGKPSEETLVQAASNALETLQRADDRPIFLIGESLGAAVAVILASHCPEKIAGIFLITPFDNLNSVATVHFPLFPLRWILKDHYDAEDALKKYQGPVAIMLAEKDRVVPPMLGHHLFETYQGPKKLWLMKNAGHNTIDFSPLENWWQEVFDFLTSRNP